MLIAVICLSSVLAILLIAFFVMLHHFVKHIVALRLASISLEKILEDNPQLDMQQLFAFAQSEYKKRYDRYGRLH